MTNLDRILKSRHITLPTKVHLVKAIVFLVVMYACESWTINKAEHQRINAFELWYWRLLRVSWTARRSNQSILKKINPQYSLEGLMLKLKLQYLGHTPSTFWLSLVLFQCTHIWLPHVVQSCNCNLTEVSLMEAAPSLLEFIHILFNPHVEKLNT